MFARLYQTIIHARNSFYESGVFKSHSLGAFTVSIGNITAGGTGKTPLVALVAETLAERGERVCVLTRGYGRKNPRRRVLVSDGEKILADVRQTGDEPFELAGKLLEKSVIVVADANRAAAGVWAREQFGITAFVLDDAFQHRRVRRDLDIVCVDATNPFGSGKTLPWILREPLANLRRADAIVITRTNLARDLAKIKSQISKYNSHCPIFVSENRISRLTELKNFPDTPLSSPPTANDYLAFCALGNPNNFFDQMRTENYNLVRTETFPDHHFYTEKDVEKLLEKARQIGANALLTTAKDAVKLKDLPIDLPCLVAESELIFSGEIDFKDWILKKDEMKQN